MYTVNHFPNHVTPNEEYITIQILTISVFITFQSPYKNVLWIVTRTLPMSFMYHYLGAW
jgi:hypothetical protein